MTELGLPYYSSEELWRELTTDKIGFYTTKTCSRIPSKPGVYAWFLPLELKNDDLHSVITKYKKIFSYDAHVKETFNDETDINFQWQEFNLSLNASLNYNKEKTPEKYWGELKDSLDIDELKSLRQMLLLSSLFTKPLYVGLTKNLNNRYEQHTTDSKKNCFNQRFNNFSLAKNLELTTTDLLFSCVTLPVDTNLLDTEKKLNVLEYLLKNISGPIFGER